jgi:hypothetical protein
MHQTCTRLGPFLIAVLGAGCAVARGAAGDPPGSLEPAVADGPFLRPAAGQDSEPTWGIKGGLSVGLWPNPGPRGLIRVYTPYLGQPRLTPINFIAVEPVVDRLRGLSELEKSHIDPGVPGKAMWSTDHLDREGQSRPRKPWRPARGVIGIENGRRTLTVFIEVEPFDHGARPIIEVRFREDRPHELMFRVYAAAGGEPMRSCILTATMGNYARLRRLHLKDHVVDSRVVYHRFQPVFAGFAPHHEWALGDLLVHDGQATVAATPDEAIPSHAQYEDNVARWWHYQGAVATQYWRAPARAGLVARVNGRQTYWASNARIPGGVAFENFELEAPFHPGQVFHFGIIPETQERLGFQPH